MKILTRDDLRAHLRKRELAPVYVLYGPETHLRDLAAKTIADFAFGDGDFRDFNETEFSLNTDGNLRSALSAAEQLPMMANRRVIRVCDVRVSSSANKDTLKETDEQILAAYLDRPAESSIVIFVADEFNGTRKLGRMLRDKAIAVEFAPLTDADLTSWARNKVAELGSEIDEPALRHLIALVGPDVRRLTTEIGKVSTAALPGKAITFDLVDSLVANARELDNFELTKQLTAGNQQKVLEIMKKIFDDGAEPLMVLGMISYNFRRLLMAKEMMDRGASRPDVARILKLRYNDQEPVLAAARRSDRSRLAKVLERLAETDVAIKTSIGGSGPKGARTQVEMLVCELAAGAKN